MFLDAFDELEASVLGKRRAVNIKESRMLTKNALDEILKYFKIKPKDIPEDIENLNEKLEYILRPHGIMRRSVELEKGWRKNADGIMLASLRENGLTVALVPGRFGGYYFTDPATGNSVRINSSNEGVFERDAVVFYDPFPLKSMTTGDLFKYMFSKISPGDVALILIATIAGTLIGMLLPILNNMLFSNVILSESIRILVAMAVFIICVTLSQTIINVVKQIILARIETRISIRMQSAIMARVLSLPVSFFKSYGAGELQSRVSQIDTLATTILDAVLSTSLTGLFSLVYIFQIFAYAPALVIPSVVVILATFFVSIASAYAQTKLTARLMEVRAKNNALTYAILSGITKIRLAGAEKRAFSRWAKAYANQAKLSYNPPIFLKINTVITTAIGLAGTIFIYLAAAESAVSVSEYYAFNSAYGMVSGAFVALAGIALTVAKIRPVLDMVRPILAEEPEISQNKEMVTNITGAIDISHVTFKYADNMPNVLEDISLKIDPGQYVAICGKTGCGKSTLIRLILGFETPQNGGIFFDTKDIANLDLRSLRRRIGCVMQDGNLFSGDIYSNIVISAPWLTMDDAWEAAEMAGIAEDIKKMPMGMHTYIPEDGRGISGGQRQRIMIARAIAPKPNVLIFDEATSALDNITQKKVSESLDVLNCTRVVVAHRLSTIRHCDRIIVLDGGKIIEDGTYEELIAKGGFFKELVERQQMEG